MSNYKDMYIKLAARVADAIELLIAAQQQGEDGALEEDTLLEIAPRPHNDSTPGEPGAT